MREVVLLQRALRSERGRSAHCWSQILFTEEL